ncbi:MAG: ABC transporter substrate-binding protein [Dehalococcoidia bacterium]|nr:ABC transporter substrate-binding protein [Dehalococcoidia bacterium]
MQSTKGNPMKVQILKKPLVLMAALLVIAALAVACSSEPTIVEKEVPVEIIKEVVVEVEKEVVVEVEKEVVREVMVPGETVVVEKEVQKVIEIEKPIVVEVEVAPPPGPKGTIVFSDLNWASAQVQNRIAQYIVEEGYGYPTDVVFGSTLPLFQGLRRGDSHVTMEIWLPNQDEAWMEAQSMGEVVSVGESLGKDWQSAFVIPTYLQQQYPDLDSVDDLKDDQYKMLFETAETGGKARLVSCVIGWACEEVNAAQITGYGLDDHVHIVNPGDGAAANADLYGAYEKQEPWLGYQWGTNDPALVLDLVRLEEPAYTDECWFTTKACAYEDATILIAVHPDILAKAPDVVQMLRAWDFNIGVYKEVAAWMADNEGATTHDAALWWLNSNQGMWSDWVTGEAAASINAALSSNKIPDGWPDE